RDQDLPRTAWRRGRAPAPDAELTPLPLPRFSATMGATPESRRSPTIEAKTFAATLARWCQDKKALDITVYGVSERLGLADYFLFVTGLNRTHVRALENE